MSAMDAHHRAALDAAEPYEIELGRWLVELDGYPGVWAVGESSDACRATLTAVLEAWLTANPGRPRDSATRSAQAGQ